MVLGEGGTGDRVSRVPDLLIGEVRNSEAEERRRYPG